MIKFPHWPPTSGRIVDLSQLIQPDSPVYPGDSPIRVKQQAQIKQDGYALSHWDINFHTATHIDAPCHFFENGISISNLDPEFWFGSAWVIPCQESRIIGLDTVMRCPPPEDIDFLLFNTGWDKHYGDPVYFMDHPTITEELGLWLSQQSLKGIGVDMASPDTKPYPIHHLILGSGKIIIENMKNLNLLPEKKTFPLICIPLPIEAEASWVRPIALLDQQ